MTRNRGAGGPEAGVALEIVSEADLLPETADLATFAAATPPAAPGAAHRSTYAAWWSDAEVGARMAGRAGGAAQPPWAAGTETCYVAETALFRIPEALHWPEFGAVADQAGHVMRAAAEEGCPTPAHLSRLSGVHAGENGAPVFSAPADLPRLPTASVFMAWGGEFNYGHFVLDCLTALLAVEEAGLLARFPPIAPPLKPWRRELLALAFGPDLAVQEVSAPVLAVDDALYASPMRHFLHSPNALVARLRERVLARAPLPEPGAPKRVYLSRRARSNTMRVMLDEAELERGLEARGFAIVRPETLSATEQVRLMRGAEVVAGPTGAGMANALFAAPGARVFEIQPENFTGVWLRNTCWQAGLDWFGWFAPSPVPAREVPWTRRIRGGFQFAYRTGVAEFLRFMDERL